MVFPVTQYLRNIRRSALELLHDPEITKPSTTDMHEEIATTYETHKLETPTSIVYLSYPPSSPPPVPPSGWTRFVCISDTHSQSCAVPPGDVLLHSGDLTAVGRLNDFKKTTEWLRSLPHPIKIIIAGNHDLPLHEGWYEQNFGNWPDHARNRVKREDVMKLLLGSKAKDAEIIYLQDEAYEFQIEKGGRIWTVYGSPWQPWFFNWAFNYQRGNEAESIVKRFPKSDILLTHGPPYGILDLAREVDPVGCEALRARLPDLQPRLHVFGHIHEAHGVQIRTYLHNEEGNIDLGPPVEDNQTLTTTGKHTVFVNAANMPQGSRAHAGGMHIPFGGPGFQPVIVDLMDGA